MIDIPKLIGELERAGDGWGSQGVMSDVPRMQGLCRQAAAGLKEQQDGSTREVMQRLGLVLIELGRKLTGQ